MYKTRYGRITNKVNYQESFEHEDNPKDETYVEDELHSMKTELKLIREYVNQTKVDLKEFVMNMNATLLQINTLQGERKFTLMIEMFEYMKKNMDLLIRSSDLKNFRKLLQIKLEEFKKDLPCSSATKQQRKELNQYFDFFLNL